MANQLTLGVGINAAALQAAINNVVNRTYTINGVQINNRGIAQAQQALGRITGSASEFQKSMEAANARVVAFGASAGVIYVLKRAFDGLISSTIEVENSITEINSILNLSSRQISTFSSQLFSAANSVSVSFDDASKAATEFARQGLGVEQTLKRTRDSLILAKISGMDFVDSATAITAALNSFSSELITSTDLVDRLTNADANFAVSSRDLAEAIKRVGSSASEANISLNETIALVTAAQQTTARGGAVIGNSFKTIFTRLSRGSVLDDLEAIGVKTRDASGNTLPLIQVLKNLSSTYDTLSSRQQSFVAEMVGGVYQINILKSTLRDLSSGASVFSQALSTLENSTGSAQARINQLNETISAKLIVTLNNLKEISSAIGSQTFAPILKGGLDVLNSQLETFKEFSGEGIGKRLADGILGGIKGALAGPGAFFAGFFATKLLGNFGGFVRDSISSFAGLNSAAQQQAQIQNQIVQYLQRNPALLGQIHSGATTVAQAHQQILAIIRQENALLAYQTQQAGIIASMAYRSGVRVAPTPAPGPARGYIPNFSSGFIPNFSPETRLARSLGASAGVKEVPGKGEIGGSGFVANSQETQIPNFAGSGETAVIPHYGGGREKAAKMIAAGKSGPILASGFIPNFYKDEVSDIRILRAFLKIQKEAIKKGSYRGNLDESGKLPVYRGVTPWKSNMTNEDHFSNPIYPRMGPTGYRSGPLTQELHKKQLSSIVFDHQNAQHIYSNAVSTSINKGVAGEFGTSVGEKRLNPLRILGNEKEYEKLYRAFGEARVKSVIFRNTKALGGRGLGLDVNKILPDSNFTHEDEIAILSKGFIPNFALKLLDRDYITQMHGEGSEEIFNQIVNKAAAARKIKEIIAGAPGVGKTTLAMSKGAKPIASAAEFDPEKDELIAVRSILSASSFKKDETNTFFDAAEKITMLRSSQKVVDKMRSMRDEQIRSGTSKTGFGRNAGSTRGASADSSVMEAILTERYADKLKAFERNEDFSLTEVSDRKTIKDIGSVAALVGNFGPFTKGHEKLLNASGDANKVIYVSGGEKNRDYGLGLSAGEKVKMIEKQYPGIPVLPIDYGSGGMGSMFNYKGQVYRYNPKEGKIVLGADRANDEKYTKKFTSQGFEVMGIPRSSEDISATLVRKAVVENDLETLAKYLPDKVFGDVSSNIGVLQKRAALIQQRKDKASPLMQLAQKKLDEFVAQHGNRKKPKEDPSITETRNALKAKLEYYENKVGGKFKGGVFRRMGLGLNLANGFIPNFAPLGNVFDFDGTLGLVPKNPVKTPDGTVRKITHADTYHGWSASHMIPSPLVSRVRKRKEPITVLTARGQDSIPFIQEWLTKQNIPFEQVIGTGDSSRYPKDIADNTPRKKAYELNKMGASGKKFYEDSDINLRVAYRLAGIKRRLVDFGNEGIGQLANGFIPNFASMQLTQFKPTASERELQGGKVPFAAEEISSVRQFVERLRKKYPQMSGIRALMTGGRSQEKRIERGSNFTGIDSAVSGMLGGKKFAFMIQTKAGKPKNVKEKDLKFEEGLSDLQKNNPEFLKDVNEFVNILSLSSRNKPEGFQKKLPMFGAGVVPKLSFRKTHDKEFDITRLSGFLKTGDKKSHVGDIEFSGKETREIEAFDINKEFQGKGFAKQFYAAMGKGKTKGTLLPNYDKNGNVFFPQLSRARASKDSIIHQYDAMENVKQIKVNEFEALIAKHKGDKKYWENNSFDLISTLAKGFIPNFAIKLTKPVSAYPRLENKDKADPNDSFDANIVPKELSKTNREYNKEAQGQAREFLSKFGKRTGKRFERKKFELWANGLIGEGVPADRIQSIRSMIENAKPGEGYINIQNAIKGVIGEVDAKKMEVGSELTSSGSYFDIIDRNGKLLEVRTRKTVSASDILKKGINQYLKTHNIKGNNKDDEVELGDINVILPKGTPLTRAASGFIPNFAASYSPFRKYKRVLGGLGEISGIMARGIKFGMVGPEQLKEYGKVLSGMGINPGKKITESGVLGVTNVSGRNVQAHRGTSKQELRNLLLGEAKIDADITNNQNIARGYGIKSGQVNQSTFGTILHLAGLDEGSIRNTRVFGTGTAGNIDISGRNVLAYSKISTQHRTGGQDDTLPFAMHEASVSGGKLGEKAGIGSVVYSHGDTAAAGVTSFESKEQLTDLDKSLEYTQGRTVDFQKMAARYWRLHGKKLEAKGAKRPDWVRSAGFGFIPNFASYMGVDPNSVNAALKREMSAGYSSSEVRVGFDDRLNNGVGVYNESEGSLSNAINMHLASGKSMSELQTQGKSRGFIPNFADESDTGSGTSALISAIFGSIAAMRQNTEAIKNQTRAQNLNDQIERAMEPEQIRSSSQGTGGLLGDIRALFGKGQDIRNLKEIEKNHKTDAPTVAAVRTATQIRKASAAQSLTIPAMAIGPAISAAAGAMDQGPAKAAMENFSNSANIASAAFAAFPGPVGAGIAGVLLVGGAARSLYKYFNDYGQKIALAIEAQENTNKQFESNGQAVIQGYAKLNDAMYNASVSASQMSQIQDQINSAMANIPESLKQEFQTRIRLAANQEERAAIFAEMNSKRASETEALKTFNVGQKKQEEKFGNRERYFDRGFFGRAYGADLSKTEMDKGKEMARGEASSIISYAKQNLNPAMLQKFAEKGRNLESIVPDDMMEAVREMDSHSREILELTIRRQLAEEALNKTINEEFKPQLEAERELKRSAQERINLAREEAAQLNKLADAMSTFTISAGSTLRNAELKGQTDVFGTRIDIAKQKTGAGTGAALEAYSDFVKKTSAIEQTRSEKTSQAIENILSKGTGDKKEGASLTENERAGNVRISRALNAAGGDIEKAKKDRSITAEDLKRMNSPELTLELEKIHTQAALQTQEAKIQSDYLYQSLKAQAEFQRNLKVGGGISGFTNPSQRRDMAGNIAVSTFGLGSSSVEGRGRSAFDLLKNTQGLMGGALKNTPAVQSLKELAVKGNEQSLRSTFADAIQGLKMSGSPQAAGIIPQFQELMAQSRKIAQDQIEADLQLEELPQKTYEVAQQQLAGLKSLESAVNNGFNSLQTSIANAALDIGINAAKGAEERTKRAGEIKKEEEKRSEIARKNIENSINAFKNNAEGIADTFKAINSDLEKIYSKYGKKQQGGLLAFGGMINGPSHARGGVPIFNRGNQIAEVEGGEYVINKRSTAANIQLIEAINSAQGELKSGGVVVSNVNPRRFESGGAITSVSIPNQSSPVNLSVAVNPASKEFGGSLTFPDANSILEMINVLSAKINEINISMLNQRDDQKNLAPGIYR